MSISHVVFLQEKVRVSVIGLVKYSLPRRGVEPCKGVVQIGYTPHKRAWKVS